MKIPNTQIKEIIELSKKLKQSDISKIYNVSTTKIGNILRENGVNTKRSRLNESKLNFDINYFDIINTEEKAYWLGFIAADGCLKSNKVRLVSKDEEVIVKFKNSIKSEHKITRSITTDKRTNKKHELFIISITNNLFTRKVEKYLGTNKSDELFLPKMEDELYRFFIAGIFDGDGSLSIDKDRLRVSLISTKECLKGIQDILFKNNIGKRKIYNHYTTYRYHIYGDTLKFLKYIYDDKFEYLYLSRKYKKYKDYDIQRKEPINIQLINNMLKNGIVKDEICKEFNISISTLNRKLIKINEMKKKKIFVDMDNTLCDFMGAFNYYKEEDSKVKYPQSKIGFFTNLRPLPDAIESFNKLKEHYDMWILTRPSFKNIHCFSEKAQWILDNLGFDILEKLVISGDKSLIKGDYLIDDHHGDGQPEFEGEWIHFRQGKFKEWVDVVDYLIKKETE